MRLTTTCTMHMFHSLISQQEQLLFFLCARFEHCNLLSNELPGNVHPLLSLYFWLAPLFRKHELKHTPLEIWLCCSGQPLVLIPSSAQLQIKQMLKVQRRLILIARGYKQRPTDVFWRSTELCG